MFAHRFHSTIIDLKPEEEILYRLPPMSAGAVLINVKNAYSSKGVQGAIVTHTDPTLDLQLELSHSEHLNLTGTNHFFTDSLWHDDLWRLRVKRISPNGEADLTDADGRLGYRIEITYPSLLPILERKIPASFFHDGFEVNWNQQQYVNVALIENTIRISFQDDLARLYDLPGVGQSLVLRTDPLFFKPNVAMISQELDIGAGPLPGVQGNVPFISFRVGFPAVALELDLSGLPNPVVDLTAFHITIRLYLRPAVKFLEYVPVLDTNVELEFNKVLDIVDAFGGPDEKEAVQLFKEKVEEALYQLQHTGSGISEFGRYLTPWLVGGPIETNPFFSVNDLFSIGYAPGAGDVVRPNGTIEPATGDLIVRYIGPRPKPNVEPVLLDPDHPPSPSVDDGSIRLFELPDEDPILRPPASPVGGPFGGVNPNQPGGVKQEIGNLAKIDHFVILMQENRSFDQVLGYLSRDGIKPEVDGLLPQGDLGQPGQVNIFKGVSFFPQKADKDNPPGNPRRTSATEWPKFPGPDGTSVNGPCHDTACVSTQMVNMGGFVADFAARVGGAPPNQAVNPHLRLVMDYFDGSQLPFFELLAREFSICDRWYTSHPGPTWPNRFILLTGDLNRSPLGELELDNTDVHDMVPIQTRTIFDYLNDLDVSWRVYENGLSFSRVFKDLTFDTDNIVPFDDPVRGFENAARRGDLPAVTLIEPDYIDLPPGNDDHPPADMCDGQILVERIVKALIDSPTWDRTLFIITYDEHGGFYDHRPPPTVPANQALAGGGTTLGPRVPTFFISPLIPRGQVFFGRGDSGRFFDHTSIGASILRRFSGKRRPPSVSPRMNTARDLREILTLDQARPRSDFDRIRQFMRTQECASETRTLASRSRRIGMPEGKEDFHWTLAAIRQTIGDSPQVSLLQRRVPKMTFDELLFFRDQARNGAGTVANPTLIGTRRWHEFKFLFSGGNGILYAVNSQGQLLFFRDKTQDGTGDVGEPSMVGSGGWQNMLRLFSGGNGILYAVNPQGQLLFYRDQNRDGTGDVANPKVIGQGGWQNMVHLFSGGDGILYAVNPQGQLLFYRDQNRDGTGDVANPKVIGQGGWQNMVHLFSGGDGILYAVNPEGKLLFYRDKTQDGTGDVANPSIIGGEGWHEFKFLSSGGNGIIYAAKSVLILL